MLNRITDPDHFGTCLTAIKRAYWPYNDLDEKSTDDIKNQLTATTIGKDKCDKIAKAVTETLQQWLEDKCKHCYYRVYDNKGKPTEKTVPLPFLEKFHVLFQKRKFNTIYAPPYKDVIIKDLMRLAPPDNQCKDNYSGNYGNYCHFVNVVAALSHLIHFFSERGRDFLELNDLLGDSIWEIIRYRKSPDERKFKLMLSGFYHDVGKTVVDHRHAMEGAMILISHPSDALAAFIALAKEYGYKFEREDLLQISDFVNCHDLYGTLSTGENGYIRLIKTVESVVKYCCTEWDNNGKKSNIASKIEALENSGRRLIFDLWLLNVADIIVSRKDKWSMKGANEIWNKHLGENDPIILEFFGIKKTFTGDDGIHQGQDLLHDLKITFDLLHIYLYDRFDSQGLPFKASVLKCSEHHVVARIRKLIKNSLYPCVAEELEPSKEAAEDVAKQKYIEQFHDNLLKTPVHVLDKNIENAIRSISDYGEFSKRLAWVGQLDYSLGFFRTISKFALKKVLIQLANLGRNTTPPTGWISTSNDRNIIELDSGYFIDNYTAIIIQILHHLLFRDDFSEHYINFEFSYATDHLTDEKMSRLLFFEGPARSMQTTMLILQTIFIY